jgi:hypothetical protein
MDTALSILACAMLIAAQDTARPAAREVARLDDRATFPLAVWLQDPKNAPRYAELGINTYVGLWKGPTREQLDELERCGMRVVCAQNEVGLADAKRASSVIVGWMHGDEPDNAQEIPGEKGYGPPIEPDVVVADYRRMRAADPTRPVLLNLGQGVAWDGWYGRGVRSNHPEDYARYVKGCDIASFDIYPVVHPNAEVAGKLEFVARGTQRLVEWTGGSKPVWACIETTHIGDPERIATPAQIRSEVWMALISGATGIVYFAHEWKPKSIEAGLLAREESAAAVKSIDAEIKQLAPVLHEPSEPKLATVESSRAEVPIALMCKRHDGDTYLFAVSLRSESTRAKFELATVPDKSKIEVLGESRTLAASHHGFEDSFDGYAVHSYRFDDHLDAPPNRK